MSAMPGYSPADLPDQTALHIDWDRDFEGSGQDPEAIGVVIGRWEWKSIQKRTHAEWTVDGTEVHVIRGRDEPGLMLETDGGEVVSVRVHLTDDQMRTLREHKSVQFEDSRTFPFDVTVVRRE